MSTLMLSEIVEKLRILNTNKNGYSILALRDEILKLSAELEKIADNLIV